MKINNDHQRKNAMIFYQMEMSGDRYGKLLCTRRFPECFMLANIMVEEKLYNYFKIATKRKTGHILNILRKQPWFHDPTTGFPTKWRLRKDCNNSILMTCHYPDLGSASDWLRQISRHNQSEALPRSGMLAYVISRKNQWNQCSRNVGCFLRLSIE